MKSTTTTIEEYLSYDLEALGLLSHNQTTAASRIGGKSFSGMMSMMNLVIGTRTKKYLRTKIKKGCNKGKTRVTVCNLK